MTAASRSLAVAWEIQQLAMRVQSHPVVSQERAGEMADALAIMADALARIARQHPGCALRCEAVLDEAAEALGIGGRHD